MTQELRHELQAYVTIAKTVVDRLVSITSDLESAEWKAKYLAIQNALAAGRLEDAIREYSRLGEYSDGPEWVTSRELSSLVFKALGNLAHELHLPNPGKTEIDLDQLPMDLITAETIADEKESQRYWRDVFRFDPIEEDPKYNELFKQVDEIVEKKLEYDTKRGQTGTRDVFWDTKKQILRDKHNIDWRTPREMEDAIHNCEIQFQFKCPKSWFLLGLTDNENVRFCNECSQNVFLCQIIDELKSHVLCGHCVALPRPIYTMGFAVSVEQADDFCIRCGMKKGETCQCENDD